MAEPEGFDLYKAGPSGCKQGNLQIDQDNSPPASRKTQSHEVSSHGDSRSVSGLLSSYHGVAYQVQWNIVVALEAKERLDKSLKSAFTFKTKDFKTEDPDAGKFDDLVWRYEKNDSGKMYEYNFLQAKHKLKEDEEISIQELLQPKQRKEPSKKKKEEDKRPFALEKYFNSYKDIIKKEKYKDGDVNNLIIATNISLSDDLENNLFSPLRGETIPILDLIKEETNKKPEIWIIETDKARFHYEKVNNLLRSTYDSIKLANELVECLLKNKPVAKESLLSSYLFALKQNKIINEFGKCSEFLLKNSDRLSPKAKAFRRCLLKVGFEDKRPSFNSDCEISDPEALAKELASLMKPSPEVKIVRKKLILRYNIDKLANYALVKDHSNKVRFSHLFWKEEDSELPDYLKDFRVHLKDYLLHYSILKKDDFKNIAEKLQIYSFNIYDFNTCNESEINEKNFWTAMEKGVILESIDVDPLSSKKELPNESLEDIENDINNFFAKLKFVVNYSQENLDKFIKKKCVNFTGFESDYVACEFQVKIANTLNLKNQDYISDTQQVKKFFDESGEQIKALTLIGLTLEYRWKIEQYGIKFHPELVDNLLKLKDGSKFLNSNKKIFHLITEHKDLTYIKFIQALENEDKYKNLGSYTSLSLNSVLSLQDHVIEAFKSPISNNLLIIMCEVVTKNIDVLVPELLNVLNCNDNKKIIFISQKEDKLAAIFKSGFSNKCEEKQDKQNGLVDLTDESQEELLKTTTLIFQGEELILGELLIKEEAKSLIDGKELFDLIKGETIHIGSPLPSISDGNSPAYYKVMEDIDEHCLKNLKDDIFVISGIDKESFAKKLNLDEDKIVALCKEVLFSEDNLFQFVLLDNENSDEHQADFENVCRQYERNLLTQQTEEKAEEGEQGKERIEEQEQEEEQKEEHEKKQKEKQEPEELEDQKVKEEQENLFEFNDKNGANLGEVKCCEYEQNLSSQQRGYEGDEEASEKEKGKEKEKEKRREEEFIEEEEEFDEDCYTDYYDNDADDGDGDDEEEDDEEEPEGAKGGNKKLIHFIEFQNDKFVWNRFFNAKFYIDRYFNEITIGKKLVKDYFQEEKNVKNIFIIGKGEFVEQYGISKEKVASTLDELNEDKPIFILSTIDEKKEAQKIFERLSRKNNNVHWIVYSNGELIWQSSSGTIQELSKLRRKASSPQTSRLHQSYFVNILKNERFAVIADVPGMGKSTAVLSLSKFYKKQNALDWVIHVNLKECEYSVDKKLKKVDIGSIVNFLSEIDLKGMKHTLAKKLFRHKLCNNNSDKRVLWIFDGFDEIRGDSKLEFRQGRVIKLLKFLKENTNGKVLITTRPYEEETRKLENALSVLSYNLSPLTNDESQNFLKQVWRNSLKLLYSQNELNASSFKLFAKALCDTSRKIFGKESLSFIGIPLQLQMLAEVYLKNDKGFETNRKVKDKTSVKNLLKNIKFDSLFADFIGRKYEIYFQEKNRFGKTVTDSDKERLRKSYNKDHKYLAFAYYCPPDLKLKKVSTIYKFFFFDEQDCAFFKSKLGSISKLQDLNRVGIVHIKEDDKIDFVHFTFAEYFVSEMIFDRFQKKAIDPSFSLVAMKLIWKFLLDKILCNPEWYLTRKFINSKLSNHRSFVDFLSSSSKHKGIVCTLMKQYCRKKDVDESLPSLETAISEDLVEIVIFLLKIVPSQHASSSFRNTLAYDKETPLYLAIILQRLNITMEILNYAKKIGKCKEFIDFRGRQGQTALHVAAHYGPLETVRCLVEDYGADVHSKVEFIGYTPLHCAICNSRFMGQTKIHLRNCTFRSRTKIDTVKDIVDYLIQKGADINLKTSDGDTPLLLAASEGKFPLVRTLLHHSADIGDYTKKHENTLHRAVHSRSQEVVELLVTKAQESGYVFYTDKETRVRARMSTSDYIHARDYKGNTVLHKAALKNFWSGFDYLMKIVDPRNINYSVNSSGRTILHCLAVAERDVEAIMKIFLDKFDVDVNAKTIDTEDSWTALHLAVMKNNVKAVKVLLSVDSIDINAKNKWDTTAVDLAFSLNYDDIVAVLEEAALNRGEELLKSYPPKKRKRTQENQEQKKRIKLPK